MDLIERQNHGWSFEKVKINKKILYIFAKNKNKIREELEIELLESESNTYL